MSNDKDLSLVEKPLALIVDDEQISRTVLDTMLESNYQCISVNSGPSALTWLANHHPDVIILDMNMPGMSGLEVCRHIKLLPEMQDVPVIFVTGSDSTEIQDACWESGAADFALKPVVASTLLHRIKVHVQNKKRIELLNELTYKDHLTKMHNRYYLAQEVPNLIKQVIRDNAKLSAILIDIDHFKGFNDTYGHLAGDNCLRQVASTIASVLRRPSDKVIRFGGEEFLVLLPYTDESGCEVVARILVESIKALNIDNRVSKHNVLTISAGCQVVNAAIEPIGLETLISDADDALLEAKSLGKNRYVRFASRHLSSAG